MSDRFDPGDPFDAMANEFKTQIAEMALRAYDAALYRELPQIQQLECFLSGGLAGIIGVAFSHIHPGGRDDVFQYILDLLPRARKQAESIGDE